MEVKAMTGSTKKFVESCASTFQLMKHSINLTKMKSPWHFTSINHRGDRQYAVFCTTSIKSSKALIQACIRQLSVEGTRFVVVALNLGPKDQEHADNLDYCLVSLEEILRFGDQMLEIRSRNKKRGTIILRP